MEFSIIVPVYNAETTLKKCLDSILKQSVGTYEVILVDDGSTDNSLNICQQYRKKDERFIILSQENCGPSQARNRALNIARGDWICFVDSDDSITDDYLSSIKSIICYENPDVIFLGYNLFNNKDEQIAEKLPYCEKREKFDIFLELSNKDMFGYTWIKCFKRNIIGDSRFEFGVNLFEDEIFCCRVLSNCNKVSLLRKAVYNYYIGSRDTLSGKTYSDYCNKCDKVYSAWKKLLESYNYRSDSLSHKANIFVSRCYYYGFERKVNTKKFFLEMANTSFFKEHTPFTKIDNYVKNKYYIAIYFLKIRYLTKIKIHMFFN